MSIREVSIGWQCTLWARISGAGSLLCYWWECREERNLEIAESIYLPFTLKSNYHDVTSPNMSQICTILSLQWSVIAKQFSIKFEIMYVYIYIYKTKTLKRNPKWYTKKSLMIMIERKKRYWSWENLNWKQIAS